MLRCLKECLNFLGTERHTVALGAMDTNVGNLWQMLLKEMRPGNFMISWKVRDKWIKWRPVLKVTLGTRILPLYLLPGHHEMKNLTCYMLLPPRFFLKPPRLNTIKPGAKQILPLVDFDGSQWWQSQVMKQTLLNHLDRGGVLCTDFVAWTCCLNSWNLFLLP